MLLGSAWWWCVVVEIGDVPKCGPVSMPDCADASVDELGEGGDTCAVFFVVVVVWSLEDHAVEEEEEFPEAFELGVLVSRCCVDDGGDVASYVCKAVLTLWGACGYCWNWVVNAIPADGIPVLKV